MAAQLSLSDWHAVFQRQAAAAPEVRRQLYERAGAATARQLLDVGCGTGVITAEIHALTGAQIHGLDLNGDYLRFARQQDGRSFYLGGDVNALPYPPGYFDLTVCHYLLYYLRDPYAAMREMMRVTRPGGLVLALAEPDYGGRIDYPAEFTALGEWQIEALKRRGADPYLGRRLAHLFIHVGLSEVEGGVAGGRWHGALPAEIREAEWTVVQAELHREASPDVLQWLRSLEAAACERGERILYIPNFYALGRVPG